MFINRGGRLVLGGKDYTLFHLPMIASIQIQKKPLNQTPPSRGIPSLKSAKTLRSGTSQAYSGSSSVPPNPAWDVGKRHEDVGMSGRYHRKIIIGKTMKNLYNRKKSKITPK